MKLKIALLVGVALVSLQACTIRTKTTPTSPINVQLNLDMNDVEYLGEVKGTATQTTVLGVIPVGGRTNNQASVNGNLFPVTNGRLFNNALYEALNTKPDADFVMPIATESEREQMFLGNKTTLTVRAKAYKIKTK